MLAPRTAQLEDMPARPVGLDLAGGGDLPSEGGAAGAGDYLCGRGATAEGVCWAGGREIDVELIGRAPMLLAHSLTGLTLAGTR